ncbi:MAG: hypothetical protein ACOYIF_05385 [Acetivibrionales bacterium]
MVRIKRGGSVKIEYGRSRKIFKIPATSWIYDKILHQRYRLGLLAKVKPAIAVTIEKT